MTRLAANHAPAAARLSDLSPIDMVPRPYRFQHGLLPAAYLYRILTHVTSIRMVGAISLSELGVVELISPGACWCIHEAHF